MKRFLHLKLYYVWIQILAMILFFSAAWATGPAGRVVSLSPFVTETIYLLGAQDQLLADTTYCTVPPAAAQKEKIGSVTQVNVEKIISLKPDLVISCALNRERQLVILRSQGLKVMDIPNPENFDRMCTTTLKIAKALGKTDRAQVLVTQALNQVEKIWEQVSDLTPRRVFIQIGLKPLFTANKDLYINEFIVMSNAVNIAQNRPSGVFSREEVIKQDPDVILIATMGTSKKAAALEKKRWMGFSFLTCAKNKEVYVLDPEVICHPTPVSFAAGLKQIAGLIHPRMNRVNRMNQVNRKGEEK